jgi:hypothetical protein
VTFVRSRKQSLICALVASATVALLGMTAARSASAQTFPQTPCNYSFKAPGHSSYSAILYGCRLTWYNRSVWVAGEARDLTTSGMDVCFTGEAPGSLMQIIQCRWLSPGVYRPFAFSLDASAHRGGIAYIGLSFGTVASPPVKWFSRPN